MEKQSARNELLLGAEALKYLSMVTVAVIGLGGVGGFAVEALARSGIGRLVIVDGDYVSPSNINRQIIATNQSVGQAKTLVMQERIRAIDPRISVSCYTEFLTAETAALLPWETFDYVIDAVDMVTTKVWLAKFCSEREIPLIAAMGAGNKLNPAELKVGDIFSTSVDPLARVMRKALKKEGVKRLKVVYSTELSRSNFDKAEIGIEESVVDHSSGKITKWSRTIGSMIFVPGSCGLILAAEVVKDLLRIK